MPWNDLANNQMVSYTDAQTSGATLKSGQSQVTSNQCMTRLDIVTKYNVNINILLCANNQLAPKSIWEIISGFSATLTVGNNSNQFGYRFSVYGAISNADISNPAGSNAILTDLYFQNGTLAFFIQNNSTVTEPNGWTTLNIGGTNYNRTSFSVSYNAPIGRWIYTLSTGTNPFGTTVGATRTITLN
jgi:hypothetical protein